MKRVVRWRVLGVCLVFGLAGCAHMWFAEREPWRREAERSCLKSGAVKEGPTVAIIKAIDGPGMCGADYPLRVTALGDAAVASFTDEPVRPPGAILVMPNYPRVPQAGPPAVIPPVSSTSAAPPYAPAQTYGAPAVTAAGLPLSLAPPLRNAPPDPYVRQLERVTLGRPSGAITVRPAAISPAATLACPLVSVL